MKIPLLVALLLGAITVSAAEPARIESWQLPDWSGPWQIDEPAITTYGYDETAPDKLSRHPPLTKPYEEIYRKRVAAQAAGTPEVDSGALCLPNGMPRMMRDRYLIEFVPTPGIVYTLHEYQSQVRRIYTDGRPHPEELDPSFAGHSIGRWEGDTLIVDTVGIKPGWFDQRGLPHSGAIRVTERIRRIDDGRMENIISLVDPEVFTTPWVVTKRYRRHREWEVSEYVCAENNRNPVGLDGTVGTLISEEAVREPGVPAGNGPGSQPRQ